MKRQKAFLLAAICLAVLWFSNHSEAKVGDRLKARRAYKSQAITAPVVANAATCVFNAQGRCVVRQAAAAVIEEASEDAEMDAYLATLGYAKTAGPPVVEVPTLAEAPPTTDQAPDVDAARVRVENAKAVLATEKQVLEWEIEAERRADLLRSWEAEREISRLNVEHQKQISKLKEQLVDLEPTPAPPVE